MIDNDAWTFAGADADQGFFLYMLFYRHRVARYALGGIAQVDHFAGAKFKPWNAHRHLRDADGRQRERLEPLQCAVLRFLQQIHVSYNSTGLCAASLRRRRGHLSAKVTAAALPRFPKCTPFLAAGCNLKFDFSYGFPYL